MTSIDSRVRLTGGSTVFEGTPEVFYRGRWLALCVNSLNREDVDVMCGMILNTEPTSMYVHVLLYVRV